MLDLSQETEALAHRLAKARNQSVDATVREALEARRSMTRPIAKKDMSPRAVAARVERTEVIVAEIAKLPMLDPRSLQEIIDEINEV